MDKKKIVWYLTVYKRYKLYYGWYIQYIYKYMPTIVCNYSILPMICSYENWETENRSSR